MRRSRRRIVGKWEQVEQEAREDELTELERELHREQERGRRRKPKHRRHRRQSAEPGAPNAGSTDDASSDG